MVSPMAPASGPAARARPARAARPGLSGGGGGSLRGPVAQPSSAAGHGASSLVLRPLPGPSAACPSRRRRFRSPLSRLRWRRRLFRWPRPSRLWAVARPAPLPGPRRDPAPARPRPRPPPSRAGLAADGLALGRAPRTPRPPAGRRALTPALRSLAGESVAAVAQGPRDGRIDLTRMIAFLDSSKPRLWTQGDRLLLAAGKGCNAGVSLIPRGRWMGVLTKYHWGK